MDKFFIEGINFAILNDFRHIARGNISRRTFVYVFLNCRRRD